jgi:hypothetical protein
MRILDAVAKLFSSGEGGRFSIEFTISRGQSLQESVLRLVNDSIDMSLLLAGIDGGTYTLIFEPQAVDRANACL